MEGPQVNVAMGNQAQAGNGVGWQGMTIKDILDKVDLFNFTMLSDEDEEKLKAAKAELEAPEPVVRKSLKMISDYNKKYYAPVQGLEYISILLYFRKRSLRFSSQSPHQHS